MQQSTRFATQRLIDSVWTLQFKVVADGKAEIISYNRETDYGYENEKVLPRCNVVESEGRIITSIELAPYKPLQCWPTPETINERFEVVNPKYIFDYKE